MDSLDPARTALLVVHMAKGVAGQVDTPLQPAFPTAGREDRGHRGPGTAARRVPQGQGEGGLHPGHIPARVARSQAELPAVSYAHRKSHPFGGHFRRRGHRRRRPPTR
jgi:hypothetical protein